jgi:hypothetical protein
MGNPTRVTARHHQDWDRVGECLGDTAVRILGAGPVLHAEHPELASRSHARNGIGHVQADALLAHNNRTNVNRCREFDEMIDWIAGQNLDALPFEDCRDRRADFHVCQAP